MSKTEELLKVPKCYGTYPINPVCFTCMICDYQEKCYADKFGTEQNLSKEKQE